MAELSFDLTKQLSETLHEVKTFAPPIAVVIMGCGDACPWMPANDHDITENLFPLSMSCITQLMIYPQIIVGFIPKYE